MTTTWYRVVCDRNHPLTPVADIESDSAGALTVYAHTTVRVPALVDRTALETRVRSYSEARKAGTSPPNYHSGLVQTSPHDVVRGGGYWFTCLICESLGRKKLSARAKDAATLQWVLSQLRDTLETIMVEEHEYVSREEWAADPAQPRVGVRQVEMLLLTLLRLQHELTNNPRGA